MTAPLHQARHLPRAQLELGRRATPVRLRFAAVSIAVLALLTGLVGLLTATQRQSATAAAWQQAEPLMVTAQAVDTSLSDADTTAAASFLQGRVAPATLQARYQADLTSASEGVAEAARAGGTRSGGGAQPGDAVDGSPPLRRDHPGSGLQRAPSVLPAGRCVPCRGQQPDEGIHPSCCGSGLCDRSLSPVQRPDDRSVAVARGVDGRLPRRVVGRARGCATKAQSPFPPCLERGAGGGHGPRPRPRCLGRGGTGYPGHRRRRRTVERVASRLDVHRCAHSGSASPGRRRAHPADAGFRSLLSSRLRAHVGRTRQPSRFTTAHVRRRRSSPRPMPPSVRTPRSTARSAPSTRSATSPAP